MCTERRRFLSNKMQKAKENEYERNVSRNAPYLFCIFFYTIHNVMCITRITFLFAIFRFVYFEDIGFMFRLWHLRTESLKCAAQTFTNELVLFWLFCFFVHLHVEIGFETNNYISSAGNSEWNSEMIEMHFIFCSCIW